MQAIAVDTSAALQGEGRTLQTEHRVPELDGSVPAAETAPTERGFDNAQRIFRAFEVVPTVWRLRYSDYTL